MEETKGQKPKARVPWKLFALIVLLVAGFLIYKSCTKEPRRELITTSTLSQIVDIDELSTAEFVYNGIVEVPMQKGDIIQQYIAYEAKVKIGIEMNQITFTIDDEAKTVTPHLPQLNLNDVLVDEKRLDYIPKNPSLSLNEILRLCKEDVIQEVNASDKIFPLAESNIRSSVKALLKPVLDAEAYTLQWTEEE